jgi:Insertion element 4 transposase N-terminal/Transposase DDE domain
VPRAGWVKPSDDQRLSDHVALGVLTRTFPPELVDAVVRDSGREQQRHRLLPARLVAYYVLAMALFSSAGYEEVMRNLVEGLSWESGWRQRWTVPSQPAISQARARLGAEPLVELFARACVPLATPATPGGFWRGWRLVSMDGTTLDVADTAENAAAFGRPGSGRGEGVGAYPQLRMVALAESGTHAMFAAAMGPCSTGETTLARELIGAMGEGMLVLADRGFYGFGLWQQAHSSGADLLWRTKSNHRLAVDERLADGSYLSKLYEIANFKRRGEGVPVRVVEYHLEDPGRPQSEETRYRLLTTILDPDRAAAAELAACYAERWEFESALDELKAHQRGPRVVLRSKTPDGVRQEAWGHLCTHYAIRALMGAAAAQRGVDPDRISFTRTAHAARRSVRSGLGAATRTLTVALPATLAEICRELVPRRRLRANPRVVKRKMSGYGAKRSEHRRWPQPTRSSADAVRVIAADPLPAT